MVRKKKSGPVYRKQMSASQKMVYGNKSNETHEVQQNAFNAFHLWIASVVQYRMLEILQQTQTPPHPICQGQILFPLSKYMWQPGTTLHTQC